MVSLGFPDAATLDLQLNETVVTDTVTTAQGMPVDIHWIWH